MSEIASVEIHGSCVFTDNIYLTLPEILRSIRAKNPNQMSLLAYQKLILTAQNDQEKNLHSVYLRIPPRDQHH